MDISVQIAGPVKSVVLKGRRAKSNSAFWEDLPAAKRRWERSGLTARDRDAIRCFLKHKQFQKYLAAAFKITRSYVCKIGKGYECVAWHNCPSLLGPSPRLMSHLSRKERKVIRVLRKLSVRDEFIVEAFDIDPKDYR